MYASRNHPLPCDGLQPRELKAKPPHSATAERGEQQAISHSLLNPVRCCGSRLNVLPVGWMHGERRGLTPRVSTDVVPAAAVCLSVKASGVPREMRTKAGARGGVSPSAAGGERWRGGDPGARPPPQARSWPPPGPFPARPVTPLQTRTALEHRSPPAATAVLTACGLPLLRPSPGLPKPRQRPLMAALGLRRPRPPSRAAPAQLRPTAAAGLPQGAAGRRAHGAARRPGPPRPAAAGLPAGG